MMTLPEPRYKFYQHKAFAKTKTGVLEYSDKIVKSLSTYPIYGDFELLEEM